jgi:hypothetical protein
MLNTRFIALILVVASVVALVLSIGAMGRRVSDYYAQSDKKLYMFSQVNAREFIFAGQPVTLVDERGPAGESVIVHYGDETLRLAASIDPGPEQLPHLVRHAHWMQVLRFAEHGRASIHEADRRVKHGEVPDRLVIVVRNPPRGVSADTWGQVWRKMWTFDLYEFLPDERGGVAHQRLAYPTHRRNEPAPPGELEEGTWQFYAALLAMPKGSRPTPKFTGDALRAMDWTLPVSALSVLLLMGSLAALAAPTRQWHKGGWAKSP